MKGFIRLFLCLAALLLCVAAASADTLFVTTQNGKTVNMRSGPGMKHKILMRIPNGYSVETEDELDPDGWLLCTYEGHRGYINGQYVSTQAAAQGVSLSTIHDIELDYQIYRDADDVPWVSLVITDEAATAEPIRLYALVYPEDGEESMSVALPYFDQAVSIGGTHTIDLPVSALLGGQSCHKARVAVYGIGVEERDEADNEILLVFKNLFS